LQQFKPCARRLREMRWFFSALCFQIFPSVLETAGPV
jgi:hypothetical protein